MRSQLRFLLGHEPVSIERADPTMTVLEWLRREPFRRGTKEGCAEGDCGACSVVLVRPENGRLRYQAVNSCIQFLPTLDGCQLLTVEDLKGPDGRLHPVQKAMVDHHGSQCGFCTPGFVMALFALYREGGPADRAQVDDALAGNLCRCTGYGPIIEAALAMNRIDGPDSHIAGREDEVRGALEAMEDGETLCLEGDGRRFFAPATSDELAWLLLDHPGAVILAGATDVGLWVTKQHRRLDPVIWIGRIDDLKRIEDRGDHLAIGAGVTYSDALERIRGHWPDAGELLRRLGSVQIRNMGTIGGNIANGSPIGDSPPFLIALGARIVLRRGDERRVLPLEDFFVAYGEQDRKPDEFLETILVPKPEPGAVLRCYKISKRFDQDISGLCGAFAYSLEAGRVAAMRIAYGGMAPTPKRARATEAALIGRPWTRETVEAAMAALEEDFTPISDMRASAAYRMRTAKNLILKCWLESAEGSIRLAGREALAHG